ncbi:hypothetical protein Hte_006931 [Hypoxylon texense]
MDGGINNKSILYRIPEEVLSMILQLAVTRNTPFYINTEADMGRSQIASASASDAVGPLPSARPDSQEAHIADWKVVNFTCRRFKKLGRDAFFAAKVIAMPSTLPAALLRPHKSWKAPRGFAGQMLKNSGNPKQDLACVRHLVLTDARDFKPIWMASLTKLLTTHFPAVRQCMLIYTVLVQDKQMDIEQITAAMMLARPAREELRDMLVGTGMPERVVLEETVDVRYTEWDENTKKLETCIYPILRFKAGAMRKIKQREQEEKEQEEKEQEEKEQEGKEQEGKEQEGEN